MVKLRQIAAWVLSCSLSGCVTLPDVAANQCGNDVVEHGEECDGYAPEGAHCLPPGDDPRRQCRYDCLDGHRCPDGWSCGVDELCHKGKGTYAAWGDYSPSHAHTLRLGDFDGDGRADLLALGNPNPIWQAEPRVVFFDEQGKPEIVFDPQTPISSPTLPQVLTNGVAQRSRRQITAATSFGIATLSANPTKNISSVPYPFQVIPEGMAYRMVRMRGVADGLLGEEVIIYISHAGGGTLISGNSDIPIATVGHPIEDLAGEPTAGNLVDSAESPCDELVLTFHGDRNVYALAPCGSGKNLTESTEAPHPVATLPEGHTVETGAALALVNDDSHLDLIVGDGLGCPYVAFGNGDGTFAADLENQTPSGAVLWPIVTPTSSCPESGNHWAEYPLAIGDLNGDGHADAVLPDGIQLFDSMQVDAPNQRILLRTVPGSRGFMRSWSVAAIADLNRDGRLDLVAGSSHDSDLDFFAGIGRDRMTRITIPTDGPVTRIITGDYGGDSTNDVAFVQLRPNESTSDTAVANELAIAFGKLEGAPETPLTVAEFAAVDQIISANYQTDDAIEEIGVLAKTAGAASTQLTLFVGNTGRHPISPLGLWSMSMVGDQTAQTAGTPIASTTGRFVAADSQSILALGIDNCNSDECRPRLWFVPSSASGQLEAPSYGDRLPKEAIPIRFGARELSTHFVVGNSEVARDKDGLDAAWLLTAGPTDNQVTLWNVSLPDLVLANPLTLPMDAGVMVASSSPSLLDLDGNGWRDLTLLLADEAGQQHLRILWNDRTGFDVDHVQTIEVAGMIRAISSRNALDQEGLVVVTESGIFGLNRMNPKREREVEVRPLYYDEPTERSLPGGQAVAVGDMTGDGLLDLAVSAAGGLRIYSEVPTLP
jgi:hypothetical protein